MKMLKIFLPAVMACAAFGAYAQTADDIIAKNTDAMGGAAKIGSLKTVKMTGSMSAMGQDIPVTVTKMNMKGMRVDVDIMGTSNYQILTPDNGSIYFPIQKMTEPKAMDAGMVKSGQGQLDLQGSLYNYKEKGETVEYVGTEKVDGADAYHLKVTMKSGNVVNYYVDTKSNLVVKTEGKATGPDGAEIDVETTYTDYKVNSDGYRFPYSVTTMQGPITYDKIESNVPVDESIFKN